MRRVILAAFVSMALTTPLLAQFGSIAQYLPNGRGQRGVVLQGASGYVSRYWNETSGNAYYLGTSRAFPYSDTAFGASTSIGWRTTSANANFGILYTPSYYGTVKHAEFSRMNHQINFVANRPMQIAIGRKWTADFTGAMNISTFDGYYLQPTRLAKIAAAPASFDDLSSAFLSRTFNSDELAAALTASPAADSPLAPVFFGHRFLTVTAQTGLTYSHSSRLSIRFDGTGNRSQSLWSSETGTSSEAARLTGVQEQSARFPRSTTASAGVIVNYSLSPRTQIAGSMVTTKSFVSPGSYYSSTARVTLSRTMSRRWFAQVQGGVGMLHGVHQTPATLPAKPLWLGGATLGFVTYAHTFLVSGDRSINNSYGIASSSESVTGAWAWRRRQSNWWLTAAVSQERIRNNVPYNLRGWRAHLSLGRVIGRQLGAALTYGLTQYRGLAGNEIFNGRFGVASVGIHWMPGWRRGGERLP